MGYCGFRKKLLRTVGSSTRQHTERSGHCFSVFAVLDKEFNASTAAFPVHALRIADGSIVAIG